MLNFLPPFLIFWCLCTSSATTAASRPFPQNINYPFGFKPATIPDTLMKSEYTRWKNLVLVACNGGYRINCTGESDGETRVEGMGFGMLITAFFGEKDKFDGLYKFYQSKQSSSAGNMMVWSVTCPDAGNKGSATDGDIDVAFALLAAGWQWGGTYETEAIKIIQSLRSGVIKSCGNLFALAGGFNGGAWGGCDCTDISYYNPAFFRVFAKVSGDSTWNKLADDTYTILNNSANASTGLVPDWQTVAGAAGCEGRTNFFRYDACRAPYRIALDYLWNGNENAKKWCTKVSGWANGIGAAKINDGYNLNGSANNSGNHTTSFVGGFAVAAMCNAQAMTDAFAAEVCKLRDKIWFNACTRLCYMLAMTGNLWKNDLSDVSGVRSGRASASASETVVQVKNRTLYVSGGKRIRSVDIVELSGRRAASPPLRGTSVERIDVSFLRNGSYCVKIVLENGGMIWCRQVKL